MLISADGRDGHVERAGHKGLRSDDDVPLLACLPTAYILKYVPPVLSCHHCF